ncbi:MAG: DUF192 domain-containing protein [Burkholderiaceae bacterium]|nr:DUF192 domain-containing protein [Burkholderiaceae bacterium]
MKRGTLLRERELLCARAELADRPLERLRGLLGRDGLSAQQALWIAPCNAVHTIGMRMPIDVVFLSRNGTVLSVHDTVRPNRFRLHWRAAAVVELRAGLAGGLGLQPGQQLRFEREYG